MNLSEYTTEEMLALASALGLGDPVFLATPPISEWSAQVRTEVNRIGLRSLVAREVVKFTEAGEVKVPDVLASLCGVCASPLAIVHIARVERDVISTCCFLIGVDLAAGQRITRVGNHRMTLFPTEHLASALAEVCAIADNPPAADATPLSIDQARAFFNLGGVADADEMQRFDAVELAGAIRELAPLAGGTCVVNAVQVSTPMSDGMGLTGSLTRWVDAGPSGLWLAEADEEPAIVLLRPASKAMIVESIAEGVPDWIDVRSAFGS